MNHNNCGITLYCRKCLTSMLVARDATDPKEAVILQTACPLCDNGDFVESMYYDKDGNHITRDWMKEDET